MGSGAAINSREWWDAYFKDTWEENDGRHQTRHFMRKLLANTPATELAFLQANALNILDWGCALGDGVSVLAEAFPQCTVTGLDFSLRAITTARELFPGFEFLQTPDGAIPRQFDVITISNCLEHFDKPLDLVNLQLPHCRYLYIAMVPYNEQHLHEQHQARFQLDTFPETLGGFRLLTARVVDVDPMFWPGQQLLAIYASPEYDEARSRWLASPETHREVTPAEDVGRAGPGQRVKAAAGELLGLRMRVAGEREDRAVDRERLTAEFGRRQQSLIAQYEQTLADQKAHLTREFDMTRQALLAAEREHYQQEMEDLRAAFQQEAVQDQIRIEELQSECDRLHGEIGTIYNSRPWRLALAYWSVRRDGAKGVVRLASRIPWHVAHIGYHLVVPKPIRNHFWEKRHEAARLARLHSTAVVPQPTAIVTPADSAAESEPDGQAARGPDIICFPVIDWDFRFQRPQQLLTHFARAGHRGYYLNIKFTAERDVLTRKIDTRLWELFLPGDPKAVIYTDEYPTSTLGRSLAALQRFCRGQDITDAICLVQHPFWTPLAQALRSAYGWKIVYDCMDDHSGFETNSAHVVAQEDRLVRASDLVITTSRLLQAKMSARHKRCLLIPNAGDFEHFSQLPPRSESPLAHLPQPVIGYYGAIAEWFDTEAVRAAAVKHPEWSFVLVGHTFGADIESLQRLPNVHFPGEQTYDRLPAYVAGFDVCTIPFRRIPLTEATNPVKLFEYLAAAKPVVARKLPEIEPYVDVVALYDQPEEFVARLEEAVQPATTGAEQRRQEVARANTWASRCEVFGESLRTMYPKASIIIVTYNNLRYTRLTVESILAKTRYPSYEIILVDNGSRTDLTDYLASVAAEHEHIRVILNGSNLGFAAANNIGIRDALEHGAERIVLLNNDVIVTPGWLSTLLSHLGDQSHGLVGPVTSFAGNEARIEVDYSDVSGIDAFARRYTRARQGVVFDIPMLAMFCVAARRDVIEAVGLLDEQFGMGMFEDDDYSLRVRKAGFRVICAEDVFVHHFGRVSFSQLEQERYQRLFEENKRIFEEKWQRSWVAPRARGAGGQPVAPEAMAAMRP